MILLTEHIEISDDDRYNLLQLSERTTLDNRQLKYLSLIIYQCDTIEEYEEIESYFLKNIGGIDTVVNPSYKQIWQHIKSLCNGGIDLT